MKMPSILLVLGMFCCLAISEGCSASPVEFDTDNAHVIVLRPVDFWSGDAGGLEDSLDAVKDKKVFYTITGDNGIGMNGTPLLFASVSKNPVTQEVYKKLEANNYSYTSKVAYMTKISKPITILPADFPHFVKNERMFYELAIEYYGNPKTLQSKVAGKKFIGGLAELASIVGTFGKTGTAILGSGVSDSLNRLIADHHFPIAPLDLTTTVDLSACSTIEVRNVKSIGNSVGQIILAYKTPKTTAAEEEALVPAILSLLGTDTNEAQINVSREQDYDRRLKIWNDCVASGRCKEEAD